MKYSLIWLNLIAFLVQLLPTSVLADRSRPWLEEEIKDFKPTQQKEIRKFFDSYEKEQFRFLNKLEKEIPPELKKIFQEIKESFYEESQNSEERVFNNFLKLKNGQTDFTEGVWQERVQELIKRSDQIVDKEKKLKKNLEETKNTNSEQTFFRKNAKSEIDELKILAQEIQRESEILASMDLAARYFQVTEDTRDEGTIKERYLLDPNLLLRLLAGICYGKVITQILSHYRPDFSVSLIAFFNFANTFPMVWLITHRYIYKSKKEKAKQTASEIENNYPTRVSRRFISVALNQILADLAQSKSPQAAVEVLEKLQPTLERLGCRKKVRVRVDTKEAEKASKVRFSTKEATPAKTRIDTGKEIIPDEFEELEIPAVEPKRMNLPHQ